MIKELFKTLALNVRERWQGNELLAIDILDSKGRPLSRDELPPRMAYKRFGLLLANQGYVVMSDLSFAPGRGALPYNIAVLGALPKTKFEEDIVSAREQASLTPYKDGGLYSALYDSLGNRSLRSGMWAFQEYDLHFVDPKKLVMFGPEGSQTPDSFEPVVTSIEYVVRQLENHGYFTLVSNSEIRQRPLWATPLSVIIAKEDMIPFSKGLFGSLIKAVGLPAYSSGQAYFSQEPTDRVPVKASESPLKVFS